MTPQESALEIASSTAWDKSIDTRAIKYHVLEDMIAVAIQEAVLAERQRCANVAYSYEDTGRILFDQSTDRYHEGMRNTAQAIKMEIAKENN
jgi:hypothetical protein